MSGFRNGGGPELCYSAERGRTRVALRVWMGDWLVVLCCHVHTIRGRGINALSTRRHISRMGEFLLVFAASVDIFV